MRNGGDEENQCILSQRGYIIESDTYHKSHTVRDEHHTQLSRNGLQGKFVREVCDRGWSAVPRVTSA